MGSLFSSVAAEDRGRSEEERESSVIHDARCALLHYNSKNPGAEFDLVKPLMNMAVIFRGETWHHVSFWARRRGAPPETPVRQFFGELRYMYICGDDDKSVEIQGCRVVVETCTIIRYLRSRRSHPPARKRNLAGVCVYFALVALRSFIPKMGSLCAERKDTRRSLSG
ncbi:hypothetical protein VPH35_095987 [Triticum aestivum]|uniref:uncharacterized protein n=1 Tax=Triticum aestivum TaxID=4565 RepID=UPI0008432514|nr:uncharacterized protein LOC123124369 [Triticum aestivum]